LSAGSKVEGKLTFDRPVRIDGELIGEVKAKDALILIGPEAKVKATLEVAYLVVLGTVEGSVKATEKVDLMAGGRIIGDVETPRVSIQDGGILNGRCSMDVKNAATTGSDALKKPEDKSKTKSLTSPPINGSTRVQ
jgi:cytoskeletal protein CcmA (bactofilin family)